VSTLPDSGRWEALGRAIRSRRRRLDLTLVALASRSGLSQPFLSQVENGRARPSMDSLYRVAQALGTTPQALFDDDGVEHTTPVVARVDDPAVPSIETEGETVRRLLLPGDAPFHVVECVGLSTEFLDHWQHEGFEAVYVVHGPAEIEVDGVVHTLGTGDFISYPASLPHRHRSTLGSEARLVIVETQLQRSQRGAHSDASAEAS
jgi:transcriptional regulator with XRE-family HTH domain